MDKLTHSKSERTSQYIIEKVAPIFNEKGYDGTSMSDLVMATGLTKGAIYGNFKNKDEIAEKVFLHNISIISKIFVETVSKPKSSIDRLLSIPMAYDAVYENIIVKGGCPIMNAASTADYVQPRLRKLATYALNNTKKNIATMIAETISDNFVKPDIDSDKVAGTIISLAEGGILIAKLTGEKKYFNNSLEQINEIINSLRI